MTYPQWDKGIVPPYLSSFVNYDQLLCINFR